MCGTATYLGTVPTLTDKCTVKYIPITESHMKSYRKYDESSLFSRLEEVIENEHIKVKLDVCLRPKDAKCPRCVITARNNELFL